MRLLRILFVALAFVGFVSFIATPRPVLAQYDAFEAACDGSQTSESPTCDARTTKNPLTGPNGFLRDVTLIIAAIAGFTALVVILLSGGRYMLAGGDVQKAATARNALLGAVIGLVIIISATLIINFVVSKTG